jgi:hypothetical protein
MAEDLLKSNIIRKPHSQPTDTPIIRYNNPIKKETTENIPERIFPTSDFLAPFKRASATEVSSGRNENNK